MARQDQYISQNKIFSRFEIEGEPLTVTEFERISQGGRRAEPVTCIRWVGLHRICYGDEEFLADRSMACVAGEGGKKGVSILVTRHPDVPCTEADRAENRKNIDRLLRDAFGCQVNWSAVQ